MREPHRKKRKPKSGYRGVSKQPTGDYYTARIHINGEREYLGTFETPELAHIAYEKRYEEYKRRGY